IDKLQPYLNLTAFLENPSLLHELQTIRMLSSGFIVTSLVWASALAAIIDRRLSWAAAFFLVASVCALFGVIHSPAPGSPLFLPWRLEAANQPAVCQYTLGYLLVAVMLFVWGGFLKSQGMRPIFGDESLLPGDHTDAT